MSPILQLKRNNQKKTKEIPLRRKKNESRNKKEQDGTYLNVTEPFPFPIVAFEEFSESMTDCTGSYLIMDDGTYRLVFNVTPLNTDYYDAEDKEKVKEKLISAISSVRGSARIGIYIQKETLNIDKQIAVMQQHKEKLNDVWKDTIQGYNIANMQSSAREIRNIDRFYVCLESVSTQADRARKELQENYRVVSMRLEEAGHTCVALSRTDLLQLLFNRLNPVKSKEIKVESDWELEDILPDTALLHKTGDLIEIEGVLTKQICLKKFRSEVENYSWLKDILRIDESVMIGITLNPKEGDLNSQLDKTMKRNREDSNTKKSFTEEREQQKQREGMEDLYEKISSSNQSIYDVNITLSMQATDRTDLEDQYRRMIGIIYGYRYKAQKLVRKEFEPFFATLPILSPHNRVTDSYTYNFTVEDIASTLPFASNEYMELGGVTYARNLDSRTLFILDRKNKKYHNPHLAIIADSGAGKTFAIGTFILRELPYMDYTLVVDIAGVFSKMFPFATTYRFSVDSGVVINPFHIRGLKERMQLQQRVGNVDDLELGTPITTKILDLISFFKWIDVNMTPLRAAIYDDLMIKTYESVGLSDNHIPETFDFPTLSDFNRILLEEIEEEEGEAREERKYIRDVLSPYISGSASRMLNGQTNYDYQPFTILDLSRLNKVIQPAVYDLLLNDLWNFGIKDGSNETSSPPSKSVYFDENHELARAENPQTLEFVATKCLKQGRKYEFYVTTASQGLSDYLTIPKYGQAILDNSFMKFLMRLGETDHKIAQELYNFTAAEMKILTGSEGGGLSKETKGKGIFCIGSYKVPIKTFAYLSELQYINPKVYTEMMAAKEGNC